MATKAAAERAEDSLKYATVDVGQVFKSYYKSAAAEAEIQQLGQQLEQRIQAARGELQNRLRNAREEQDRVQAMAEGPARDAAQADLQTKIREGARFEQALNATAQQYRQMLGQRAAERTQAIRAEITHAIRHEAERQDLPLILDTSATGPSGLPVFPYSHSARDLSADILDTLNANRPPQLSLGASDLSEVPTVEEVLERATEQAASAPAPALPAASDEESFPSEG